MVTVVRRSPAPDLNLQSQGLSTLFGRMYQAERDKSAMGTLQKLLGDQQKIGRNAVNGTEYGQVMGQQDQGFGQQQNGQTPFDSFTALSGLINSGFTREEAQRAIEPYQQQHTRQKEEISLQSIAEDFSPQNIARNFSNLSSDVQKQIGPILQNILSNQGKGPVLNEYQKKMFEADASQSLKISQGAASAKEDLDAIDRAEGLINKGTKSFGFTTDQGELLKEAVLPFYKRQLATIGANATPDVLKRLEETLPGPQHSDKTNRQLLDNLRNQTELNYFKALVYRQAKQELGESPGWTEKADELIEQIMQDPNGRQIIRQYTDKLMNPQERQQLSEEIRGDQSLSSNPAPAGIDLNANRADSPLLKLSQEGAMTNAELLKKKVEDEDNSTFLRKGALAGEGLARESFSALPDLITAGPRLLNQGVEAATDYFSGTTQDDRKQALADKNFAKTELGKSDLSSLVWGIDDDVFGDEFAPSNTNEIPSISSLIVKGRDALFGDYFKPKTSGERIAKSAGEFTGAAAGLGALKGFSKASNYEKAAKLGILGAEGAGFGAGQEAAGDSILGQIGLGLAGSLAGKYTGNLAAYPRATFGKTVAGLSNAKNYFKNPFKKGFGKATAAEVSETDKFADLAKKHDIKLSASALSGGKPLSFVENQGSKLPVSASAFQRESVQLQNDFEKTLEKKVFENLSKTPYSGANNAGLEAQAAATKRLLEYKDQANKAYAKVDSLLAQKPGLKFTPNETIKNIETLAPKFNAKDTLSASEKKVYKFCQDIADERLRNNGSIPVQWGLNYQKTINNTLKEIDVRGDIKNLGYKLSEDLSNDIGSSLNKYGEFGKEVQKSLAEAKGIVRARKLLFEGPVGQALVDTKKDPAKILNLLDSVDNVRKVKGMLGKDSEAFKTLSRAKLEQKFSSVNKDGKFSIASFSSETHKGKNLELYKELSQDGYQTIEDLGELAARIKEKSAYLINASESGTIGKVFKDGSKIATAAGTSFAVAKTGGLAAGMLAFSKVAAPIVGIAAMPRILAHPTFKAAYQKSFQQYQKTGVINTKTLDQLVVKLAAATKVTGQNQKTKGKK